jgi:hypothetical protein
MNTQIGSPYDCGYQDWLHDRACDPHCIENGDRQNNLTMDLMLEYIKGWNDAKEFFNRPIRRVL